MTEPIPRATGRRLVHASARRAISAPTRLTSIARGWAHCRVDSTRRLRSLNSVARAGAVGVMVAAIASGLTFFVLGLALSHSSPRGATSGHDEAPRTILTANSDFLITSAVSSSPSCDNVAFFLPGAQDYICYTVHNPYTESFTVSSISISKTTAPANCPVSNLDLTGTTYSGTPALVVAAHSTGVVAEPISMVASATNQDTCLGAVFQFTNAGTARVTTPPSSSTTTTTTTSVTTTTTPGTSTTAPVTSTTIPVTTTTQVPSTGPLAFTGSDIAGMGASGALAVAVGGLLLLSSRRRRRASVHDGGGSPE